MRQWLALIKMFGIQGIKNYCDFVAIKTCKDNETIAGHFPSKIS